MEETASSRAIVDALAPYGFTIEYPLWKKSSAMIRPFAPH